MSISLDIGTSEVKLVELNTVNNDAVLSKIHCKSTWKDLESFDPEKLEKSNKKNLQINKVLRRLFGPLIAFLNSQIDM